MTGGLDRSAPAGRKRFGPICAATHVAPDDSILITARPGRLRLYRNGKLEPTPIAGVPAVRAITDETDGALLQIEPAE